MVSLFLLWEAVDYSDMLRGVLDLADTEPIDDFEESGQYFTSMSKCCYGYIFGGGETWRTGRTNYGLNANLVRS